MKRSIPALYGSYGRYIDQFRAIPSIHDCLKVVERRVLCSMHDTAKKQTKCAKIVGDCIGKYHPHGDASTYDTLVNLVNRGFGIGQGNFGYDAVKPTPAAAYRYTEAKINPTLDKLAFELIKYVPHSDPEGLDFEQPEFLPSPVSIGLIGDGIITGISFNTTKIPRYDYVSLFKRLTNIFQRQIDPNVSPETIIPNIPNFDIYEFESGEFEKILTTGEGKIILRPKYMVDKYGVHVYGRPPMGCMGWLKEDTDLKKVKFSCDDLSGKQGFEALFSPKNGTRFDQNFVNLIIKVTESVINFQCNVWDDEKVTLKSIDELLLHSYNNWSNCLKQLLNEKALNIRQKIREMLVIEVIRYLLNTYASKMITIDDLCNLYNALPQPIPQTFAQDVTIDEIKSVCKKHSIQRLFDYHIDKLENENLIQNIESDLNNFNVYAYDYASKILENN